MKTPIQIELTNRERFGLFVHCNQLQIPNRAEGRRLDKVWAALGLDALAEAARKGLTSDAAHDHEVRLPFVLVPEERDALIDYLDRPMAGGFARLLARIGDLLIAHRDAKDPTDE
jgi:hypothetical protein